MPTTQSPSLTSKQINNDYKEAIDPGKKKDLAFASKNETYQKWFERHYMRMERVRTKDQIAVHREANQSSRSYIVHAQEEKDFINAVIGLKYLLSRSYASIKANPNAPSSTNPNTLKNEINLLDKLLQDIAPDRKLISTKLFVDQAKGILSAEDKASIEKIIGPGPFADQQESNRLRIQEISSSGAYTPNTQDITDTSLSHVTGFHRKRTADEQLNAKHEFEASRENSHVTTQFEIKDPSIKAEPLNHQLIVLIDTLRARQPDLYPLLLNYINNPTIKKALRSKEFSVEEFNALTSPEQDLAIKLIKFGASHGIGTRYAAQLVNNIQKPLGDRKVQANLPEYINTREAAHTISAQPNNNSIIEYVALQLLISRSDPKVNTQYLQEASSEDTFEILNQLKQAQIGPKQFELIRSISPGDYSNGFDMVQAIVNAAKKDKKTIDPVTVPPRDS